MIAAPAAAKSAGRGDTNVRASPYAGSTVAAMTKEPMYFTAAYAAPVSPSSHAGAIR